MGSPFTKGADRTAARLEAVMSANSVDEVLFKQALAAYVPLDGCSSGCEFSAPRASINTLPETDLVIVLGGHGLYLPGILPTHRIRQARETSRGKERKMCRSDAGHRAAERYLYIRRAELLGPVKRPGAARTVNPLPNPVNPIERKENRSETH